MCEELSYQITNTSAVNQAVFCYYQKFAKIIIKNKQATQRNTFLNSFKRDLAKYICTAFGSSEFLNIHIFNWHKVLIRYPVVLFGILILLEQFDDFEELPPWCIPKDRQLCLQKYLNTEFYIQLLLRQNKSRYKIWHSLELGCSCKQKQSTNKEIQPMQ